MKKGPWGKPTGTGWISRLRWPITALWVGALSLFLFHLQCTYLAFTARWHPLAYAGHVLRLLDLYWASSLAAGLACGLAWFGVSHLYGPLRRIRWSTTHVGRVRIQALGTFCLAAFLTLFVVRVLLLSELAYVSISFAEPLSEIEFSTPSGAPGWWLPPALAAVVVATGVLVFMQTLHTVRLATGRTAGVWIGFGLLFAAGLLPVVDRYRHIPTPFPGGIWQARDWPVEARRLIIGGPGSLEASRALRRLYFETLDTQGRPISRREISEARMARGSEESCSHSLLPDTILFTWAGIPVQLHRSAPATLEPSTVIEVPLSGEWVRVYRTQTDSTFTMKVDQLETAQLDDWVVLKVDADTSSTRALELFRELRDAGVHRVTLAAHPIGFGPTPPTTTRIFVDESAAEPSGTLFAPRERRRRGNVITVKKYIPPPGAPPSQRRCSGRGRGELEHAALMWEATESNSLSGSVRIELPKEGKYQEFISLLDRAIAGGAQSIHVSVTDPL